MREDILKLIDVGNNKINHYCLNEKWWIKKKCKYLYDEIFTLTNFLSNGTSFRERLFYIQNDLNIIQVCDVCKINQKKFTPNELKFRKYCKDINCYKQIKRCLPTITWNNFTDTKRYQIRQKIQLSMKGKNKGTWCELYGEQRANEMKREQVLRLTGKKQSLETIEKRMISRRGKPRSVETKRKISISNKKTHNSLEFKQKMAEVHKQIGKKMSIIMKEKIKNGTFTPNITNSWTKKNIEIMIGGNIVKCRSSWEAAFWILNPTLQYEKLRIQYQFNNEFHTYIVDFIDFENKIIYEIKPKNLCETEKNICKFKSAQNWCNENGWKFKIISNDYFIDKKQELIQMKFPYLNILERNIWK